MSLRPHQIHAINGIADHPLCVVNHFCGTGKTHIMKALLQMMTIGEVAILVFPSLALIHQFHSNYASQLQQFQWLTVCSEKQDVGFVLPHTTQLQKVIDFLKREDSRVLTVTYDSLPIVLSAISPPNIDEDENELYDVENEFEIIVRYLMFDEAHHVTEKRNRTLLWKDNVWQVPNVKQTIFFTASLRNKSGIIMDPEQSSRINAAWEKYDILPQQDEKEDIMEGHCGPIVSRYTHRQAVLDGTCNDFALRCDFGISRPNISREQIVLESILRAMITNNQSRALTFHSSIVKGVNVYTNDLLMAAWEYLGKPSGFATPEIIHLSSSTQNRPALLAKFEAVPDHGSGLNQLVILAYCRTIGEGIDTQKAQVVVFADPKKSQIDILQNIGRVCRAYDHMKPATVLIPVVVNKEKYMEVKDDDVKRDELIREDINKGGDFNAILRVSSALRQLDPELYSLCWSFHNCFSPVEVKENLINQGCSTLCNDSSASQANEILQQYQGNVNVNDAMTKFSNQIGRQIEVHSTSMSNPIQTFGSGQSDPLVVVYDEKQSTYELLQKNTKKKLEPPKRRPIQVIMDPDVMILWHTTDALDFFARTQTATLLAKIRVVSWETNLERFTQFLLQNGKYPSRTVGTKTELSIGKWVSNQRKQKDKMSPEYKTKLDNINFIWKVDTWPKKRQDLEKWLSESNGDYPSRSSKDNEEKKLAEWVNTQRTTKKNLSVEQKQSLENMKFVWSKEDKWEQKQRELQEWLSKNGNKYPSNHNHNTLETSICNWVSEQRANKAKTTTERRAKLDKMCFVWDITDPWPQKKRDLVIWLLKNNNNYPNKRSKNPTESTLAGWVGEQRRKDKIAPDRKAQLDEIGFIWTHKKTACLPNNSLSLSSNELSFIPPSWFVQCVNIAKLLIGTIGATPSMFLKYLKSDEHKASQVFQVYSSMKFKEAISTMLQNIQITKFTKKLIDPLICESRLNCEDCGPETIFQLYVNGNQIQNSFSMDITCNICKSHSKQQIVKLGMKCLVLCDIESNLELPTLFTFKKFTYSIVSAIEESKSGEWSQTTMPDFIGKTVHCVVYDRGKLEKKVDDEPQKKRVKKSKSGDSLKSSNSVPIISNPEFVEEKTALSNALIELANPILFPNKRKVPNSNETTNKKPRTLATQLQAKKDKMTQEHQILAEAERLSNLQNPTKEEEHQLDVLKRQLGMSDDTYNEANHDEKHMVWKQAMNMVFTELVSDFTLDQDNLLYLDGEQQHTTTALRLRFGNTRKLYVANWSQETCTILKESGTINEVQYGSLVDLLHSHWKKELFAAAYLDLCSGSASTILEGLQALLHYEHKIKFVGFTMTQRDPEGQNQVERLDRLEAYLRELSPKMIRVADLPKFKHVIWTESGVVTRFYVL
jgi:superfamily II DNA or RNA helicase